MTGDSWAKISICSVDNRYQLLQLETACWPMGFSTVRLIKRWPMSLGDHRQPACWRDESDESSEDVIPFQGFRWYHGNLRVNHPMPLFPSGNKGLLSGTIFSNHYPLRDRLIIGTLWNLGGWHWGVPLESSTDVRIDFSRVGVSSSNGRWNSCRA